MRHWKIIDEMDRAMRNIERQSAADDLDDHMRTAIDKSRVGDHHGVYDALQPNYAKLDADGRALLSRSALHIVHGIINKARADKKELSPEEMERAAHVWAHVHAHHMPDADTLRRDYGFRLERGHYGNPKAVMKYQAPGGTHLELRADWHPHPSRSGDLLRTTSTVHKDNEEDPYAIDSRTSLEHSHKTAGFTRGGRIFHHSVDYTKPDVQRRAYPSVYYNND